MYTEPFCAIEQLSCSLGLLAVKVPSVASKAILLEIRRDLRRIERELDEPGRTFLPQNSVDLLEEHIALVAASLAPLASPVIPGGCEAAALCYVAAAACRSAEAKLSTLDDLDPLAGSFRSTYLNRLRVFLVTFARLLNKQADEPDLLAPA